MKIRIIIIAAIILQIVCLLSSCNSGTSKKNTGISSDTIVIEKGISLFNQHCVGCHNIKQDGIGPLLGGITSRVSIGWMQRFIENPHEVISSGDEHAMQLFAKYKVAMPSFSNLKEDEVQAIIAYLNAQPSPVIVVDSSNGNELLNPIADTIGLSKLVVNINLFTQIQASVDSGKRPFTRITKLDYQPVNGSLFVVDLRGKLYKLQNNLPSVYMDIAKLKPKFIESPGLGTGFGSFTFHPDFAKNGLFYTVHSEAPGSAKADFNYPDSIKVALQSVVTEWKADNPAAPIFSGKSRELFRVNMPNVMHGIQEIAFNPFAKKGDEDYGLLYICVGDGGSVETGYPFLPHNIEHIWGTILRINPLGNNSASGQYGIPANNPFVKNRNKKALGEIYAYGFRNPHRISWTITGKMLACNIGQQYIESLDIIEPGKDYGWPIREGIFLVNPYGNLNKVYALPANDSIYKITYPVAQYQHHWGYGAISGGYDYSGASIPALQGKYLFGDIPTGKLFYVEIADLMQGKMATIKEWKITYNGTAKTLKELCGNDRVDLHFGKDAHGEMYILTKSDGKIYRITGAEIK